VTGCVKSRLRSNTVLGPPAKPRSLTRREHQRRDQYSARAFSLCFLYFVLYLKITLLRQDSANHEMARASSAFHVFAHSLPSSATAHRACMAGLRLSQPSNAPQVLSWRSQSQQRKTRARRATTSPAHSRPTTKPT
jgi:hypothetical protein